MSEQKMSKVGHDELVKVLERYGASAGQGAIEKLPPLIIQGEPKATMSAVAGFVQRWFENLKKKGITLQGIAGYKDPQYGQKRWLSFAVIDASILLPVDFSGIPGINIPTELSSKLFNVEEGSYGIIFFHNINVGQDQVRKTILEALVNRKLGEMKLPETWIVLGHVNALDLIEDPHAVALMRKCSILHFEPSMQVGEHQYHRRKVNV